MRCGVGKKKTGIPFFIKPKGRKKKKQKSFAAVKKVKSDKKEGACKLLRGRFENGRTSKKGGKGRKRRNSGWPHRKEKGGFAKTPSRVTRRGRERRGEKQIQRFKTGCVLPGARKERSRRSRCENLRSREWRETVLHMVQKQGNEKLDKNLRGPGGRCRAGK